MRGSGARCATKQITSGSGPPPRATPNPVAREVGKGETLAGRRKGVCKGGRGRSPRGEWREEEVRMGALPCEK